MKTKHVPIIGTIINDPAVFVADPEEWMDEDEGSRDNIMVRDVHITKAYDGTVSVLWASSPADYPPIVMSLPPDDLVKVGRELVRFGEAMLNNKA